MYIWRIERLKTELRAGPMPSRRVLPYILGFGILFSVVAQLPFLVALPDGNTWDVVNCAGTVVLTFSGLVAAYSANGGAQGSDFAARLIALSWVLGWRLIPAFIILAFAAAILDPDQFITEDAPTGPTLVALTLGYELLYYWRLWAHLRSLVIPVPESGASASAAA